MSLRSSTFKALALTALVALSTPAFAAAGANCQASKAASAAFVAQLDAEGDAAKKSAMLAAFASGNPGGMSCFIANVKETNPAKAKQLMNQIITILAADGKNDAVVTGLTDENADLIALADADVEPAGGTAPVEEETFATDDAQEGGNDTGGQQENPGQLSGSTTDTVNSPANPI